MSTPMTTNTATITPGDIAAHRLWLRGEPGGVRLDRRGADLSGAYLSGTNLSRAYLSGTNLSRAYLSGANLTGAYLSGADLSGADLTGANLTGANCSGANLTGAYLSGADLSGAYLTGANLSRADLTGAYLSRVNLSGAYLDHSEIIHKHSIVPEVGRFTGFKKVHCADTGAHVLLTLEVPATAKRMGGLVGRKCRVSKARVVKMETPDGEAFMGLCRANYDRAFKYQLGDLVEVLDFCEDPKQECAPGIHLFVTRREAAEYAF